VTVRLDSRQAPREAFRGLLADGFEVEAETGVSLSDLLQRQFSLDPAYVAGRLSTIFLDGHPVDDLEGTIVRDGATLALSAAMPGLVGATLRRGGALAPMRAAISHREAPGAARGTGRVRVKLFNLVLDDLGAFFLERGIIVPADAAREALPAAGVPPELPAGAAIRLIVPGGAAAEDRCASR
jgi:hypothetical protein